jgi:hypothetical protein
LGESLLGQTSKKIVAKETSFLIDKTFATKQLSGKGSRGTGQQTFSGLVCARGHGLHQNFSPLTSTGDNGQHGFLISPGISMAYGQGLHNNAVSATSLSATGQQYLMIISSTWVAYGQGRHHKTLVPISAVGMGQHQRLRRSSSIPAARGHG